MPPARSRSRSRPGRRAPRARRRNRWWLLLALPVVLTGGAGGAIWGAVVASYPVLPELVSSEQYRRYEGVVYARDGQTVLRRLRGPDSRRYAKEAEIPKTFADAVVAIEDRRFRSHHGIDAIGIARAFAADVRSGSPEQGGSTITQQLVKNTYVGPRKSLARKSREAILALALETRWSKRRILTAYLNTAYYGRGAYGAKDAARVYFDKALPRLGLAEAALLAGLLRSPSADDPIAVPARARARRDLVLDALVHQERISPAAADHARHAPLPTATHDPAGSRSGLAPHFVDGVVAQLIGEHGVARTLGGGLRVRTTLHPRMQRAAVDAVHRIERTGGLSAAIAAIDVRSGEVVAMAMGGPARRQSFNVATNGQRQPGSAFKPFALAAAYDRGFSPDSRFTSAPFDDEVAGVPFEVTNASGRYAGEIDLEDATRNSDNTVYARLVQRLGIHPVIRTARDAGITSPIDEVPSLVLGALPRGVSPVELARAYATFARRGVRVTSAAGDPLDILKVSDPQFGVSRPDTAVRTRVLPAAIADLVTSTLRTVLTGTGTRARLDRPAAGKTGTTEEYADAWFAGYTPQLAAAVWVGDLRGAVPMRNQFQGGPVTGGSFPAEIWREFMSAALHGTREQQFVSERLRFVRVRIDSETRLLAGPWCSRAVVERILESRAPTRTSDDCPDGSRPAPDVEGLTIEDARALLKREDFDFEEREVPGAEDALGRVTSQIPSPGTQVRRDRALRLLVVARAAGRPNADGEE